MLDSISYLQTVIETMQDGLMVVDQEGEIVSVNRAMEELTGYRKEELIGSNCSILDCDSCFQARAEAKHKYCMLFAQGGIRRRRCRLKKKDGSPLHVLKNAVLLHAPNGEVLGGVETLTDLTDVVAKDEIISSLQREMGIEKGFQGILGKSAIMLRLFDLVASAAESEAPVLIAGESGTGKEMVARAIHQLSPRAAHPFISVNCAALNDALLESELFGHVKGAFTGADRNRTGRFEAAQGGSIFLDEVGDLPPSTQVKLLRVLQEKTVERVGEQKPVSIDARIVTATNKNLKSLMAAGSFREDLYYRIGVIPIHLPPLRERREDIPLLAKAYIDRIALRSGKEIAGIGNKALEILMRHDWPGNVRELINALEYAFVLCRKGPIQPDHLPPDLLHADGARKEPETVSRTRNAETEKREIRDALAKTGGRKEEAAALLGISRVTLWKRLKKYGIETPSG